MMNITKENSVRKVFDRRAVYAFCAVLLVVSLTAVSIASFFVSAQNVRSDVLRLHVIANSDSPEDQAVKLTVRDEVLKAGADIFDGSVTAADARERISPEIKKIEKTAERVLRENGFDYEVRAETVNEYFDARAYGDITLPSGRYEAVRIVLGEGKGKIWWCVMFPPLCLPAVTDNAEKSNAEEFPDGERRVVEHSQKYEIRFKIAEIFEKLFAKNRK